MDDNLRQRLRTAPMAPVRRKYADIIVGSSTRHNTLGSTKPATAWVPPTPPARSISAPRPTPLVQTISLQQARMDAPAGPRAEKTLKKRRPLLQPSWLPKVFVAMGILVFLGGAAVSIIGLRTNKAVTVQVHQLAAQQNAASSGNPSSTPSTPSQSDPLASYTVAPANPRIIQIASIGIKTRIIPTDVDANNQIKAPASLQDAGWYKKSALPGKTGAMFLYGHLSGWDADGVFKNLKKLQPGAEITVERGDGTHLTYVVKKAVSYDVRAVDMNTVLAPVTEGKSGLNIMTCDGKYDANAKEFTQRLVVFAEQKA